MKKTILLSTVLAATAALATSKNYDSDNVFGLRSVSYAKDYTLVAIPFVDYGTGGTEVGVKVNEIIKTSNLSVGDKIYASNGSDYDCWELQKSGNEKIWVSVDKVNIAGSAVTEAKTTDAAAAALKRGDAFWLVRSAPSASAFYLMGQAPTEEGVTVSLTVGNNLVANTKSAALDISTLEGVAGDSITLPTAGKADQYFAYNGSAWLKKTVQNKMTKYVALTDGDKIPAGVGFIYKAATEHEISL